MSQASPIVCPMCRLNDQIRKVRAIVSAGTSTFNSSGIRPSAHASTDLSKRLAAPEKRELPKPSSPALQYFREPEPKFEGSTAVILLGVILSLSSLFSFVYFTIQAGVFGFLLVLAIEVPIGLGPIFFALRYQARVKANYAARRKSFDDSVAESNKQLKASHEQALSRWQAATAEETRRYDAALSRWNEAYYCHRDDRVFLPGSHVVPPERMSELLAYP